MILAEIETYLSQHERVALPDLARHLAVEPDALRAMLRMLERKGRVRRLQAEAACGGCSKCDPDTLEIFEWAR